MCRRLGVRIRRARAIRWSRRPDASIADRIAQLGSRGACDAELEIWGGASGDAQAIVSKLRTRYPAADRKTRGANAEQAATTMLDHDVPSAFVPAMAVLASIEGKKKSTRQRENGSPNPRI